MKTQLLGVATVVSLAASAMAMCPPDPISPPESSYFIQDEFSWGIVAASPEDIIDSKVQVGGSGSGGGDGGFKEAGEPGPDVVGQWAAPMPFPVIAIHTSLMHTGEVLAYAYPGSNQAKLWNPATGLFTAVNMGDDIFCSGHTHLADGRLYVAGGNQAGCDYKGLIDTNIFDPVLKTWSAQGNMANGRWYPTTMTLGDGRVLIFSGLNLTCQTNNTCEMFTPAAPPGTGGVLSLVPEGQRSLNLYPRMHLLSNGKIAHVGTEGSAWTFQLGVGWQFVDNSNFGSRSQGTSVLLPGYT